MKQLTSQQYGLTEHLLPVKSFFDIFYYAIKPISDWLLMSPFQSLAIARLLNCNFICCSSLAVLTALLSNKILSRGTNLSGRRHMHKQNNLIPKQKGRNNDEKQNEQTNRNINGYRFIYRTTVRLRK